ncbi:MAG: tetratricopeptide repeat protein [Deltaproteobacteria bacterium]|jgi:tetratricopeptide (TPR) repeat protein|nr:tetratricopeptide repeat protein [Deltaproteobacteria bacterium]
MNPNLANLAPLSRANQEINEPKSRRTFVALTAILILIASAATASFFYFRTKEQAALTANSLALRERALNNLWAWVGGSENGLKRGRPPFLATLKASDGAESLLGLGAEYFLENRFDLALAAFEKAAKTIGPDPRLLALQAAANLRLLNYGRAKDLYQEALALRSPEDQSLERSSEHLGLAVSLFHQPDPQGALKESIAALSIRSRILGPHHPDTLAALNVEATSLLALNRAQEAGEKLLKAVNDSLAQGLNLKEPVLWDCLGILTLAYETQDRLAELTPLINSFKLAQAEPESPREQTQPDLTKDSGLTSALGTEPTLEEDSTLNTSLHNSNVTHNNLGADLSAQNPPLQNIPPENLRPDTPKYQEGLGPQTPTSPSALRVLPASFDPDLARKIISEIPPLSFSSVRPALALALISSLTGNSAAGGPPDLETICRSPVPGRAHEIFDLCLILAQGLAAAEAQNEALAIVRWLTISSETIPEQLNPESLIDLRLLSAVLWRNLNKYSQAEQDYRKVLELLDGAPLKQEDLVSKTILAGLGLSDSLLEQNHLPIESELELTTVLTKLKSLKLNSPFEQNLYAPILLAQLGLVTKASGRDKDSRAFFNQALKSAESQLGINLGTSLEPSAKEPKKIASKSRKKGKKKNSVQATPPAPKVPNQNWLDNERRDFLTSFLDRLALASNLSRPRAQKSKIFNQFFIPNLSPTDDTPPQSPEIMRLELTALKLLGRTEEIEPMITSALEYYQSRGGFYSPLYLRYQSLWLKYLEESGDINSLLAALDQLAANPGFNDPRNNLTFTVSALKYKARVLENAGLGTQAWQTLNHAAYLISEQAHLGDLAALASSIQTDLERLKPQEIPQNH